MKVPLETNLKDGMLQTRIAPESITAVNSGLIEKDHISTVELGKYYGSMDTNTLRVVFNEPLLHPFQPYNSEANANQLSYF